VQANARVNAPANAQVNAEEDGAIVGSVMELELKGDDCLGDAESGIEKGVKAAVGYVVASQGRPGGGGGRGWTGVARAARLAPIDQRA
jgi:hypothetical protein